MSVKSPSIKVVLGLALLLCLVGVYTAFTWIMGDLYGYKVRYAVEQWQERAGLPESSEIDQVLVDADTALGWEVGNPQYHELKARVLYYKALAVGTEGEGINYIQQAKFGTPSGDKPTAKMALQLGKPGVNEILPSGMG